MFVAQRLKVAEFSIPPSSDAGVIRLIIQTNPTDIRRPYVATKTAEKMLAITTLGSPAAHRAYLHTQDGGKDRSAHAVLVSTKNA